MRWACDCADWIETRYYVDDPEYILNVDDCIFIEPARAELAVPEWFHSPDHWRDALRLTGRFYLDTGIPASYEMKTEGKPTPARVFRYERMEIIAAEPGQ